MFGDSDLCHCRSCWVSPPSQSTYYYKATVAAHSKQIILILTTVYGSFLYGEKLFLLHLRHLRQQNDLRDQSPPLQGALTVHQKGYPHSRVAREHDQLGYCDRPVNFHIYLASRQRMQTPEFRHRSRVSVPSISDCRRCIMKSLASEERHWMQLWGSDKNVPAMYLLRSVTVLAKVHQAPSCSHVIGFLAMTQVHILTDCFLHSF